SSGAAAVPLRMPLRRLPSMVASVEARGNVGAVGTGGGVEETAVREPPVAEMDLEQRFRLFVGSHRERARRLAWRLVGGDDAAAEDVTQEAFFKAYRALDRFREEASLATWFYRIVVRQAHDYCRWRTVRQTWSAFWHGRTPEAVAQETGDPLLRQRIA